MKLLENIVHKGLDPVSLMEEHGVRVAREGDLALFKYGKAPRWTPITRECRGVILRETSESSSGWEICSRPLDKFFRVDEGHCPVTDADIARLTLVEKLDGSCIQTWWDTQSGRWRASTLGSIPTGTAGDSELSYSELFWATLGRTQLPSTFARERTFVWELCTPHNQIVTQYERPFVTLLTSRCLSDGRHSPPSSRYLDIQAQDVGACRPHALHPWAHGLTSLAGLADFTEAAADHERYGFNPEGFVLYDDHGVPWGKIKNKRYTQLHAFGGGDFALSRRRVVDAIFLGTIDEVESALRPDILAYATRVQQAARSLQARVMAAQERVEATQTGDRKAWALAVQDHHEPGPGRHWAFQRGPGYTGPDFSDWLAENYEKFSALWEAC